MKTIRKQIVNVLTVTAVAMSIVIASQANAGLVGHWKFDGNLNDSTVNLNNGAALGDAFASTVGGKIGGAANLDGTGDAVKIAGIHSLIPTPLSISFWIRS